MAEPSERRSKPRASVKGRSSSQRAGPSRRVDLRARPTALERLGVLRRYSGFFYPDVLFVAIGALACLSVSFLLKLPLAVLLAAAAAAMAALASLANLRVLAVILRAWFRCRRMVPAVPLWRYLSYCSLPGRRRDLIRTMRAMALDVTLDPRGFCLCIQLRSGGAAVESVGASLLADALCRQRPKDTHAERGGAGLEVYYEGNEAVILFRLADDHLRQVMGTRVRRLGDDVKKAKYVATQSADTVLGPLSRAA